MLLDTVSGQLIYPTCHNVAKPVPAVGREITPNERVIRGLVGQGHGLEAIAAFLQLDREQVLDWVGQLDLPTPHDRPWRQSRGPKAWAADAYVRFIECWSNGWHAASIGELFGRSVGAVWSKARWLGLPRRERRAVVRVQTGSLVQAKPSLAADDFDVAKPKRTVVTAVGARLAIPTIPLRNHVLWTPELDEELANRYWANQHYEAIAEEWGLSARSVASRACRLELPRRERARLVSHYDPSAIAQNIAEARYVNRECLTLPGWRFWAQRNGPRTSKRGQKLRERGGGGYGYGCAHAIGVQGYSLEL